MNWHIPVYSLGMKNPFYQKIEILNKYITISSIPKFVMNIIIQRHKELKLHHPERVPNNYEINELNYFPREKGIGNKIPYAKLFEVRDWIGKISGYRYYCEYFDFFDDFMRFYNEKNVELTNDRYKNIELILSVMIHEPHLTNTIKEILPDVNENLIEFINSIISGKLNIELLYYKWNPQSIIRLLFIFNRYDYQNILSDYKLSQVIKFCETDKSSNSLDYIFYALFNEIPFSKDEIPKKEFAQDIDRIVKSLINKPQLTNSEAVLKLKQFSSSLNCNPWIYNEFDEKTSINGLVSFFMDEKNIKHHNECLSSRFGRLIARIDDCQQCIFDNVGMEDEILLILNEWDKIRDRVEIFLKYMSNLEQFSYNFFNGKLYNISHKNDFCFASILNELNEIFYTNNFKWNERILNDIETKVKYLLRYLVLESSEFVRLFTNPETNCCELWQSIITDSPFKFVDLTESEINNNKIQIHFLIVNDFIYNKILANFTRHASDEHPIKYKWLYSENELVLEITNNIKNYDKYKADNIEYNINIEDGNNILKIVEDYYDFRYISSGHDDIYIQKLIFKIY